MTYGMKDTAGRSNVWAVTSSFFSHSLMVLDSVSSPSDETGNRSHVCMFHLSRLRRGGGGGGGRTPNDDTTLTQTRGPTDRL